MPGALPQPISLVAGASPSSRWGNPPPIRNNDPVPRLFPTPRPLFALTALLLGGCKLIDQTSFGARPVAPAPDFVAEALKPGSKLPLMTIRFDGTPFNYDAQLKSVLELAQARRPEAKYQVVTVVPASGDPGKDIHAIENGRYDVRRLEDAMGNDGIAGDDIRTSARTEKGVTAREIRIYVE